MDGDALKNFDPLNDTALQDALKFENDDLVQRGKELAAAAEEWGKVKEISTPETAEAMTDFLSQVAQFIKDADARRDKKKRIYDTCAKTVQTFFKGSILDVVSPSMPALKMLLNRYLERERQRKAAEAEKARQDALAKAQAATTPDEVKAAAKDLKIADRVGKAAIKSDFGSSAHQSSRWDFEIEDITKVPLKFMAIDRAAVMAYIKTGTEKEPVKIDGIKIKRVTGVSVG